MHTNLSDIKKNEEESISNKYKYGQYFTKKEIVKRTIDLIQQYKNYNKDIKILEPSSGTGNFTEVLKNEQFNNIVECEIDSKLTNNPIDFFNFSLNKKFDLIIGNPPFTKYNLPESYYYLIKYAESNVNQKDYCPPKLCNKAKEKIENLFILKSLKHLKDKDSTIGFVLPISFFIKNRNKYVKEEILKYFNTIIIYQNNKIWFDYHIPCCFAIFTNCDEFSKKIIIQYENSQLHESIFGLNDIHTELIPEIIFNKNNGLANQDEGVRLINYILDMPVKVKKSFSNNNVSAKNILEKVRIPANEIVSDYLLAVVRVGNSSVGKCGLIDIKNDVLNDMFYVFEFNNKWNENKEVKERICALLNNNQSYFKNITCRVGSKSIKKEDIYEFKINI